MNVGDLLGLDEGGELLNQARASWEKWAAEDHRFSVVDSFDDLRTWLPTVERPKADSVLLALAMLASPDGGDDRAAAGALAKCLLPGVCVAADRTCQLIVRGQLATNLSGSIRLTVDEMFASQLWIEVRSFPWRRLTRVAANILMNTRAGVLRELGDNTQLWRTDRTWANTSLHDGVTRGHRGLGDMAGLEWDRCVAPPADVESVQSARGELLEVLAWACGRHVITPRDRRLLLVLVEEAAHIEPHRTGRGWCGLVGNELSRRVAPRIGVSEATVRRRASKSMAALAAALPGQFNHE